MPEQSMPEKSGSWANAAWLSGPPGAQIRPAAVLGSGDAGSAWKPQQNQWALQQGRANRQPVPQARTKPGVVPAFVPDASQSTMTTGNTIIIQGQGLGLCGDDGIDEACRQIAISWGFSVHDHVRIPSVTLAHIEFPHRDAAAQFSEATKGSITIKGKMFTVKYPQGGLSFAPPSGRVTTAHSAEAVLGAGIPTDTLIVRQLGPAGDAELHEAFVNIAPRVRSVRVVKDCRGQPRGHGFVYFQEVYEATNALRHFRTGNCTVNGRRCTADFASPQTFEEGLECEVKKKAASRQIGDNHAQALSGPNADMWATYLSMFDEAASQEAKDDSMEKEGRRQAEERRRKAEEYRRQADEEDFDPEPDTKRPRTEDSPLMSIENQAAYDVGDLLRQIPSTASAEADMRPPLGGFTAKASPSSPFVGVPPGASMPS